MTADGSSGYPAEAGRYHLYVSWACPWAQRAAVVRELMGLTEVVGMTVLDPIRDERLTLCDVNLFTTLVRFDAVYHIHFKCNQRRLVDYPSLWPYARDLYQRPAFRKTTNLDHIKRHYYQTHPHINPSRIVPLGPEVDWGAPHARERLA